MGEISSAPEALHRFVERPQGHIGELGSRYEAGPCGSACTGC